MPYVNFKIVLRVVPYVNFQVVLRVVLDRIPLVLLQDTTDAVTRQMPSHTCETLWYFLQAWVQLRYGLTCQAAAVHARKEIARLEALVKKAQQGELEAKQQRDKLAREVSWIFPD